MAPARSQRRRLHSSARSPVALCKSISCDEGPSLPLGCHLGRARKRARSAQRLGQSDRSRAASRGPDTIHVKYSPNEKSVTSRVSYPSSDVGVHLTR